MRPNELAQQTIQNREHEWNKTVKKAGSNALKLGATLGGAGIAGRLLPFLSEFITPEIALKGITKVSPKIGDFLNRGMTQGLSLTEGLKYLKSQLSGEGQYAGGQEEEEEEPQQMQPQQPQAQPIAPGSIRGQLQGQQQPQAPQAAQQPGPGQQALMQVIQQLQQARGK